MFRAAIGVATLSAMTACAEPAVAVDAGTDVRSLTTWEACEARAFRGACMGTLCNEYFGDVDAVSLQRDCEGILWTWSLSIAAPEAYDGRNLPMPAVSADCVAIAYPARKNGGEPGSEAAIVFVDKRAGKKVDTLILGKTFGQSSRLELRGLGEALLVLGKGPSRGSCLEILERLR